MHSIKNWLDIFCLYQVSLEFPSSDASVVVKGTDYMDVPATATRDYKFNFTSYKEGAVPGTVRFLNVETKEYIIYTIKRVCLKKSQQEHGAVLVAPVLMIACSSM